MAFQASLAVADTDLMELWAGEFAPYVTGDRRRVYFETLSRFRASQGEGVQALANFLELLDTAPGPEFFAHSAIVALTLDIFRALQDGDTEGHSAGLTFLANYALTCRARLKSSGWPTRDSIAVFTPREETRARLGEGFQYWNEANFVQLIRFFERTLEWVDSRLSRRPSRGAYSPERTRAPDAARMLSRSTGESSISTRSSTSMPW